MNANCESLRGQKLLRAKQTYVFIFGFDSPTLQPWVLHIWFYYCFHMYLVLTSLILGLSFLMYLVLTSLILGLSFVMYLVLISFIVGLRVIGFIHCFEYTLFFILFFYYFLIYYFYYIYFFFWGGGVEMNKEVNQAKTQK